MTAVEDWRVEQLVNEVIRLADEQETANLISIATATYADGSAMFPAQADQVRAQILERLGPSS